MLEFDEFAHICDVYSKIIKEFRILFYHLADDRIKLSEIGLVVKT